MRWLVPLCSMLALISASTTARADELDSWCAEVQKASNVVICSDPELRQGAVDRNKLFEVARQTLSPAQYKALVREQTAWIRSYTQGCGVPIDGPVPTLPVPQTVLDCYRQSSRVRTAELSRMLGQTPPIPAAMTPQPSSIPVPARPRSDITPTRPTETGYDLYLACISEQTNIAGFNRCLMLLHGIWDGAMTMQNVGAAEAFCPKTGVQVGQMALIYVDWARKHPSELGHDAALAAVASFVDAFPCPRPAASSKTNVEPIPSGDVLVK